MAISGGREMLVIVILASFIGSTLSAQCSYYSGAYLLTKYCATSCCGNVHTRTCCASSSTEGSSVGMVVGAVFGSFAIVTFFVIAVACNKRFRRFRHRRVLHGSNNKVVSVTTTTTTVPRAPPANPHTNVYPPPPPPHHNPAFPPPMYPPPRPPTNNNDPAYPPHHNHPPPPYQPLPAQTYPGNTTQPQAQSVHTTTTTTVTVV